MKVFVFNQQKDLPLSVASVKSGVKEFLRIEGVNTDELSVYFVTTEEISRIHQVYFKDPSTTDCITFPIDPPGESQTGYHVLGEIFICPQTALDYQLSHPEENVYQEITLYLVHGLLHLLGYDDLEEDDQQTMRAAEKRHLQNLQSKGSIIKS